MAKPQGSFYVHGPFGCGTWPGTYSGHWLCILLKRQVSADTAITIDLYSFCSAKFVSGHLVGIRSTRYLDIRPLSIVYPFFQMVMSSQRVRIALCVFGKVRSRQSSLNLGITADEMILRRRMFTNNCAPGHISLGCLHNA